MGIRNVNLVNERLGAINYNNHGSKMVVVEYVHAGDIRVKFEQGNLMHTKWEHFRDGNVKNPYDKTVHEVGYVGEGHYKPSINSKHTRQYITWLNMIKRCYDEKEQKRRPNYTDCTVAEEWHNFQTFAAWYDENYYEIGGERMCLDKDILIKGNKIYSPDTCIFVPNRINLLFTKNDVNRGNLPIGVSCTNKKYLVHCVGEHLGSYDTSEEAFLVYKTHKEKTIKEVANQYKDKIPEKLFVVLMNYRIDITD